MHAKTHKAMLQAVFEKQAERDSQKAIKGDVGLEVQLQTVYPFDVPPLYFARDMHIVVGKTETIVIHSFLLEEQETGRHARLARLLKYLGLVL